MPSIIGILVIIRPCQVPFLGSVVLPSNMCHQEEKSFVTIWQAVVTFGTRIVLATWEAFVMLNMVVFSLFYAMFILISGIIWVLEEASEIFKRKMFTSEYRDLQVMGSLLNDCVRNKLFPIFALASVLVQIIAGFLDIKHHAEMNVYFLAFVTFILLDATLFNLIWFT